MLALAAVEAFLGEEPLDADLVKDAFAEVTSPGRLEVIRRSPTILLDAAHNPHGAQATADAIEDSFLLNPLIGVVGVMADKDYEGVLAAFEPVMAAIVCTENTTTRTMRAEDLAEVARGIFGIDRVYVAPAPPGRDRAGRDPGGGGRRARRGDRLRRRARHRVRRHGRRGAPPAQAARAPGMNRSIRRSMCAGMLVLQAVVLFLTGVVTIGTTDIGPLASLGLAVGLAVLCVVAAGMLGRPGGYALGWARAGRSRSGSAS